MFAWRDCAMKRMHLLLAGALPAHRPERDAATGAQKEKHVTGTAANRTE